MGCSAEGLFWDCGFWGFQHSEAFREKLIGIWRVIGIEMLVERMGMEFGVGISISDYGNTPRSTNERSRDLLCILCRRFAVLATVISIL